MLERKNLFDITSKYIKNIPTNKLSAIIYEGKIISGGDKDNDAIIEVEVIPGQIYNLAINRKELPIDSFKDMPIMFTFLEGTEIQR